MQDAVPSPRPAPASRRDLLAYVGPFGLFVALLIVPGLVKSSSPTAPWFLHTPEFWVYPLQTLACGAWMFYYRRDYPRGISPLAALIGAVVGGLVFVLWISPQAFFHFAPRLDGFNPLPPPRGRWQPDGGLQRGRSRCVLRAWSSWLLGWRKFSGAAFCCVI